VKYRIAQFLHMRNVHVLCRSKRKTMEWPAYRLDDGTLWKPDISGIPPTYEVHVPR
jgi:hypothetical protein